MVDAFPLPRHREKIGHAGSRYSRKGSKHNGTLVQRHSATTITRAILGDIQRAVEQLQSNMSTGSCDGSQDGSHNNSWHKNAWRKLPKMGRKSFEGWPVRRVAEGHVSSRPTSPPIDDAFRKGHKRHPNITEKIREIPSEYGLVTAAQRMPSPQSFTERFSTDTEDRAGQPSTRQTSPFIHQSSSLRDVVNVPPLSSTSSSSFSHGYTDSPATPFSMASPLKRSYSAPFSPRERLYVHPTEWTVEETVNWLRSKGFEDTVCEKFIEQETAGDALLNLDATSLKTEIGIIPYGKRFRIVNAIEDLRLVASVRFPLVKQPSGPRSPSHGDKPSAGLKPLLLRPSSMGNLVTSPTQPLSGHRPKSPMLLPPRVPDPDVQSTVEKPTDSDVKTRAISPLHPSRSVQDKTAQGRPLRLSSFRSDGALVANAKRAAIGHEGEKRGNALRCDSGTMYLATQRHPRLDESLSPSAAKPLSPSIEPATSQVAPRKGRSQLFRELREVHSDALSELSPTSTLVGTPGLIPKSRQNSFGSWKASAPSPSTEDDTLHRKAGRHETPESNSFGSPKGKSPTPLRRSASSSANTSLCASPEPGTRTLVDTLLVQIGISDHEGWMRKKGEHFGTWRNRYLVLKGPYLYWLASDNPSAKVEGHVNVVGCRIVPDENIDPGSYGFKLLRGSDDVHFFSSEDQTVVREWVKALLKPNIKRDHMKTMVFPVDLQVVSLETAQAMNPRPPSPNSAAATQRAIRRENSNKQPTHKGLSLTKTQSMRTLSSSHGQKDKISGRPRSGSFTSGSETKDLIPLSKRAELKAPVRPPRDERRKGHHWHLEHQSTEPSLIKWASGHLPGTQINPSGSICNGLELLQIAESIRDIRNRRDPEGVLSWGPDRETLEGLFSLVDFLLGEDDKSGAVNDINDVCRSKRDKIIRMLRALRAWEGHRAILQPIGMSTPQGGQCHDKSADK